MSELSGAEYGALTNAANTVDSAWLMKESEEADWRIPELEEAVDTILDALDRGVIRVAEPDDRGNWVVNEEYKEAILLSFALHGNVRMGPDHWDKVPLKFTEWTDDQLDAWGGRLVPGSVVRRSAYLGNGVIVMFGGEVNVGAYVGAKTMVDGSARVGSCAQVGERCHIAGGAGIGGVLEPPQARPTILEDDVWVLANSEVAEGAIVREGAVIGPELAITQSTRIVDVESGDILYGEVPEKAVVIGGNLPIDRKKYPNAPDGLTVDCAVIIKRVDERTRTKIGLNDLLRE